MSTFADALATELAPFKISERLQPFRELFAEYEKVPGAMFAMAYAIGERAAQTCPSKAYAPYLEEQGLAPSLARAISSLNISLGKRMAFEAKGEPAVIEAIRFLSQGNRQKRAILSRANLLITASRETSIVEQLFGNASLHEGEFLRLLQAVVDEGEINGDRIRAIAASVTPQVHRARGPKKTPASAAHELFLETNVCARLGAGYTSSDVVGDYTDPRTQATRQEFDVPHFDPRAAYRRLKSRKIVKGRSPRRASR
jgi:hypothetical protein